MGLPAAKRRKTLKPGPAAEHEDVGTSLDWRLLAIVLIAAAVPRIMLAVEDHGIFWPDEIFQSLEQAHRVVFGYGFIPWEFQDGARSWLFPGAFALLWKIASALGVRSAIALVVLAKLCMVALAIVGIYAAVRIAARVGGAPAGVLAGILTATFPGSLIFAHRCMSEMASGSVLAVAVWLWLDSDRRRLFLSGLLSSLAVFLRYQNGLIAIGLLVALLLSQRRREAVAFVAGAALGVFVGEILDWATWGRPFHSLISYLRYNVLQGRAATYGVSSWSYYFSTSWSSTGVSSLAIAGGVLAAWSRARALVVVTAVFVVVHCLIPHKEYRFLIPAAPILLALSAVGLQAILSFALRRTKRRSRLPSNWVRHLPAGLVGVVLGFLMILKASNATLASTGQSSDREAGETPVWHHLEGANMALADTGKRSDLCGVLFAGMGAVWSGGFTYLHRDVPFLTFEDVANPGSLLPFANYVILAPHLEPPPGYTAVNEFRGWSIFRREGGCAPDPQVTRLFPG